MNKRYGWMLAGAVLAMTSVVWAAEVSQTHYTAPKGEMPRREVTTQVTLQATVEKIDYKTRMLTLKDETGAMHEMKAGPEVQRLKEVKKGDILIVDYMESSAIYLYKPAKGEKPTHTMDAGGERMASQNPTAQVGATERISAEVVKVDQKNRKLTLKGPDGNVETMNVPPEVKRLSEVKKGDHVVVEHTVDMIIGVRKP